MLRVQKLGLNSTKMKRNNLKITEIVSFFVELGRKLEEFALKFCEFNPNFQTRNTGYYVDAGGFL